MKVPRELNQRSPIIRSCTKSQKVYLGVKVWEQRSEEHCEGIAVLFYDSGSAKQCQVGLGLHYKMYNLVAE